MGINNRYDRHLDPLDDESEAKYCEFCGQEVAEVDRDYRNWNSHDNIEYTCKNQFCPEKFNFDWSKDRDAGWGTVIQNMANHLAEVEQELKSTKDSLKYVRNSLDYVKGIRQEREQTIENLEKIIEKLIQSQQGE